MQFAVMGGDGRAAALCRLLAADGHTVRAYALKEADLPPLVTGCGTPWQAAQGAAYVILPLPASAPGEPGRLNAPGLDRPVTLASVLEAVPTGVPVLAGRAGEQLRGLAAEQGRLLYDYYDRETLQIGNAAATAEGAVGELIARLPGMLLGSRVLVIGFGRIGRLLARRLQGLGAEVAVSSRRPEDKAWCAALGYRALDTNALAGSLTGFGAVVNTVPAPVLGERLLRELPAGAMCLELASAPGGIDVAAAERLGLRMVRAPGLPGRTAPEAAAAFIRDAIYEIVEEKAVGG